MSITIDRNTAARLIAYLEEERESSREAGLDDTVAELDDLTQALSGEDQPKPGASHDFSMTIPGSLYTDDDAEATDYREVISRNLHAVYEDAIGNGRITGNAAVSLEDHGCHIAFSAAPAPSRRVYALMLPGYDDTAGEGEDGVFWLALNDAELADLQKRIAPMGEACKLIELPKVRPTDAGIDYHGGEPGDPDLVYRQIAEAKKAVLAQTPDITLRDQHLPRGERCWITVDTLSVLVNATDEGVVVDLFPAGGEEGESIGSTYALYAEGESDDIA